MRARGQRPLLDVLGHAVIATDMVGIVTYWNPAAEDLYGWSAAEAVGTPITELTAPDAQQPFASDIMAALAEGRSWSGVFTVRRNDHSTFLALVTYTAIPGDGSELLGVLGVSLDLVEIIRPMLSRSQEAMLVINAQGTVSVASPAVTTLFGWSDEQVTGRSWWRLVHPSEREAVRAAFARAVEGGELPPPVEARVRCRDGSWKWMDFSMTNLLGDPSVRGVLLNLRDITERRAHLQRLTDLALHDPLTGLANRALIAERIRAAAARRDHHGALLFVDLDGFKRVNDRYGHAVGDEVLRTVATRLRETTRPEDTCGRLAGDEFVVIAESVRDPHEAVSLARRVRAALARPMTVRGHVIRQPASVGTAMLAADGDADHVFHLADQAMYREKRRHAAAARRRRSASAS